MSKTVLAMSLAVTALSEGVSCGTAAQASWLILILLHCSQQQWQSIARAKAETI